LKSAGLGSTYYINSAGFEVIPSTDKVVTATVGAIINSNLEYITTLPRGTLYLTSFDFDEANRLIYCGSSAMEVHAYSMDNYQQIKKLKTRGYPINVFCDNGVVISVGSEYSNPNKDATTFIEKL
jgi:hypothetical protein